jgi:flagellar biosynthesis protein FlhF
MPISEQTQKLYVKSFFAASIAEAIQQARCELGPDALLLNSREAPPEARHLGKFEAVFGTGTEEPAAPRAGGDDLRQQMDELRSMVARLSPLSGLARSRVGAIEELLLASDVDPLLARDIEDAVRGRAEKRLVRSIAGHRTVAELKPQELTEQIMEEIESRLEVRPELGRVTALIGPPGAGKTTALVKLAITQGLAAHRPVRLISTDTQRIGGAEQLRTFASILGAQFQAVEGTRALAQAIDSAPAGALTLIDTPGYSARVLRDLGAELAAFLSRRQEIDTHLVLTASMRPADLHAVAELYSSFQPSKLLFTRLDETSAYGSMFSEAVLQAKPLSFFSAGTSIPEDLSPASKRILSESLVRQLPKSIQAVA